MSAFEHVTALLSFVYALALTHLLARIAELVIARERVRFSGLLAIGMVNAVLSPFTNWLSLWDLRSITNWDLASIAIQFLFAVSIYVICILVGPKTPDEGTIAGRIFLAPTPIFLRHRARHVILALLANLDFLKTPNTITNARKAQVNCRATASVAVFGLASGALALQQLIATDESEIPDELPKRNPNEHD